MNIVVCVKQVPDVDDIKWTKENNLDRSQMLSKINPCDEWALDYAIKIKKSKSVDNVVITVLSMGPNQAEETLRYCIAKGADRAILLSDKFFAASDTLITAKILSCAIKKFIPDFDLIITGQFALDGDTAQVPVSIAQLLNLVDANHIVDVYKIDKNQTLVAQKIDNTIRMVELQNPCLFSVKKECDKTYVPKIDDYIRAQGAAVEKYGANDLEIQKEDVGIIGSPTVVYRSFRPTIEKDTVEITENYSKTILDFLLKDK